MNWLIEAGYTMVRAFASVAELLQREFVLPDFMEKLWYTTMVMPYPFPVNETPISVFALMFGAGLAFYVGFVVVKFFVDLVL